MSHRFRAENPFISGNSRRKSWESRSTTAFPHPSRSCRSTIALPISQYSPINSRLTDSAALICAERIRALRSCRNSSYPGSSSFIEPCAIDGSLFFRLVSFRVISNSSNYLRIFSSYFSSRSFPRVAPTALAVRKPKREFVFLEPSPLR